MGSCPSPLPPGLLTGPAGSTTGPHLTGRPDLPTVPRGPVATRLRLAALRAAISWRRRFAGALTGLVVLPLLTARLRQLGDALTLPSQMLLYLLAVVVVALVGGLLPALTAAVAAAALLAYYFIPPDNFAVADLNDVVALVAFVLVAGAVSSLVGQAARRAREAVSWARLSALAIAVATSSVKPAMRCSVSAGSRPCRAPTAIAPHRRPSTTIGAEIPDRMPFRWRRAL